MHHLGHLQSLAGWDQAANMPPKGNEARAAAMAEMAALLHRMRTDPRWREQLARAEQEPLTTMQRANLREMRREWRAANALPESLVQRQQLATVALRACLAHAAPGQRLGRLPARNLREVLAVAREEAALLSAQTGLSQLRRADGPLRARHDLRRRSTACSARCGSGCRG